MIENYIGFIGIPCGICPNLRINGKIIQVPMSTEEPSVIAAASNSCKLIREKGEGFFGRTGDPIVRGQIQILHNNPEEAIKDIIKNEKEIKGYISSFCNSLKQRNGGLYDIIPRLLDETNEDDIENQYVNQKDFNSKNSLSSMIVVDILLNTCEAMGANIVNTILEEVSPFIAKICNGKYLIRINSNYAIERITYSSFTIPIENLTIKNFMGYEIGQRIILAQKFAEKDKFRACTHNKGVMNGIDAVAISCGQDWRAIEASVHAYCSKTGKYLPLTNYSIENLNNQTILKGEIEMPIPVGTVGGSINSNNIYKENLSLMGNPNSKELSIIFAAIGLANNFAALRALVTDGIQKGHMSLHLKKFLYHTKGPIFIKEATIKIMKITKNLTNSLVNKIFYEYLELSTMMEEKNIQINNEIKFSIFVIYSLSRSQYFICIVQSHDDTNLIMLINESNSFYVTPKNNTQEIFRLYCLDPIICYFSNGLKNILKEEKSLNFSENELNLILKALLASVIHHLYNIREVIMLIENAKNISYKKLLEELNSIQEYKNFIFSQFKEIIRFKFNKSEKIKDVSSEKFLKIVLQVLEEKIQIELFHNINSNLVYIFSKLFYAPFLIFSYLFQYNLEKEILKHYAKSLSEYCSYLLIDQFIHKNIYCNILKFLFEHYSNQLNDKSFILIKPPFDHSCPIKEDKFILGFQFDSMPKL